MKSNSVSTLESRLSHSYLVSSHSITDGPADRNDFIRSAKYEQEKYQKYVEDIAQKLNHIHGVSRPVRFWESVIGFVLVMHISHCRRVFEFMAKSDSTIVNQSRFLDATSFKIPRNQEDHREIYEISDFGDIQLYTQYFRLFPQLNFCEKNRVDVTEFKLTKVVDASVAPVAVANKKLFTERIARYYKEPAVVFKQLLISLIGKVFSPRMLIIECYWKMFDKQSIQLKSLGKITCERFSPEYRFSEINSDSKARDYLSMLPEDKDDFDRFFYHTLRWAAPATWLEDYTARYDASMRYLSKFKKITYIVNESLSENVSLLMAVSRERGVKAIHAEHNYLQHQFVGNNVWLNLRKVDHYLSLGWSGKEYPEIVPTSSNFNWFIAANDVRDIKILFVAGVALKRMPLTSSGYALCGDNNARRYVKMTYDFFDNLTRDCISQIYYKDYPRWRKEKLCRHVCDADLLDEFSNQFKTLDRNGDIDTVELISRSKLVVVNYLSTAYLQCLMSSVPTVILYDKDGHHLTDKNIDFYDELLSVGVMQSCPHSAAEFVREIADDPELWWCSADVQKARLNFLEKNFGRPGLLSQYLLSKIV
ncbi:LIC12162 family protein [Litoricola sp.]|nr:LIC12162 family protein [Litorivicinus sp.]